MDRFKNSSLQWENLNMLKPHGHQPHLVLGIGGLGRQHFL